MLRIGHCLNQELNYLVNAGVLNRNYYGLWYMTMVTEIELLDIKDIYNQALNKYDSPVIITI